jgi:heptosyltransferase-3
MKQQKRILVVATRRIGDVLLTTPLIRSLRRAWPEARIEALVFTGTEGILAGNPDLDRVFTVAQRPTFLQHLRFLMGLWRKYDLAVSTMSSDRPTLNARVAGGYCVGEVDPGSKHEWKRKLLSRSVESDNLNTHTVLMHLKLADLLCIPRCHEVVAAWRAEDEVAARKAISFDPEVQPYAVLHMQPMYAYKAWRREAWVELADWLSRQGMRIVLTGGNSKQEIENIRELQGLLPKDTVDAAGKLSFSGVAYLLSKASAYVGPDTVVTHLAAAAGAPCVALYGPTNPVKWGPWPKDYNKDRNPYQMRGTQRVNNVVLLQGGGDCVPCMEEGCDRRITSLSSCLQDLPAAKAITALSELGISAAKK